VGYWLEFNDRHAAPYLENHPDLSQQDYRKLLNNLEDFARAADQYRNSSERRLAPGSSNFWYDIVMRCSDGKMRRFRFVINDARAHFGVLRIEYIDEA
jgi:hypothetical protein